MEPRNGQSPNSWLGAAFDILTDNRKFGKFFLALFLAYPFANSIYSEVKDAGLVPSIERSSNDLLKVNNRIIEAHADMMRVQGEQGLRLKLAECINNAVAVSQDNPIKRKTSVSLCVSSLERNAQEMFQLIKEILHS